MAKSFKKRPRQKDIFADIVRDILLQETYEGLEYGNGVVKLNFSGDKSLKFIVEGAEYDPHVAVYLVKSVEVLVKEDKETLISGDI